MINLSEIDESILKARGSYSTVRAAHEDAIKALQMYCGQLSSQASRILKHMQPDNGDEQADYASLIIGARNTLILIEECAKEIESLAKQRAELKKVAWP